jgi:hypothetical protein
MMLGVGLAWGAEQLDPSLRDGQDFLAAAGLPVVAYLPRFEVAKRGQRRWLRWFAFFLFVLALAALWLWLAPADKTVAIMTPLPELLETIRSWLAGVTDPVSSPAK